MLGSALAAAALKAAAQAQRPGYAPGFQGGFKFFTVTRLISSMTGPGHGGVGFSNGVAGTISLAQTYTNESGFAVSNLTPVFCGWAAFPNGSVSEQNIPSTVTFTCAVTVAGTTYNVTQAGSTTLTLNPGATTLYDNIVLSAPLAVGATYTVTPSVTLTTGQKVPLAQDFNQSNSTFRPAGMLTTSITPAKVAVGVYGDSVITVKGAAVHIASTTVTNCPVFQLSIIGTSLAGQLTGSNSMAKRYALIGVLGCTHAISNWAVNDQSAGTVAATIVGYIQTMAAGFSASGAKPVWTTTTPESTATASVVTSLTSSGTTATGTIANTAALNSGDLYTIAGATQTEYNGIVPVTIISSTQFTYPFAGSSTSPATTSSSITITPLNNAFKSVGMQTAQSGNFTGGASSAWASVNNSIRSLCSGSLYDYIEWADAVTPARDDCRWVAGTAYTGPNYRLCGDFTATVTSVATSTRINITGFPSGYPTGGYASSSIYYLTGVLAGQSASYASFYSATQIILSAALTTNPSAGDQIRIAPFGQSLGATDTDGVHPSQGQGNTGGIYLLSDPVATKLAAWKAM